MKKRGSSFKYKYFKTRHLFRRTSGLKNGAYIKKDLLIFKTQTELKEIFKFFRKKCKISFV